MPTIVLPTAYLPSVAYIVSLVQNTSAVIDIHEHYIKQSCRNRCYVASTNGVLPLIVPVHKTAGNHTPVRDIEVSYLQRWQSNHWRAIESAYSSSPYYLYYKDELRPFYQRIYTDLAGMNREILICLGKLLGISIRLCFSEEYIVPDSTGADLRRNKNLFTPGAVHLEPYQQVFLQKFGFIPNLSILDLLFNLGPESKNYLDRQSV